MTDRLTEIINILRDKIERDGNHIIGLDDAARAIMALDGCCHAKLEVVARRLWADVRKTGDHREWFKSLANLGDVLDKIDALRRPDAAPARQSTWQHGDPRCDNCDNGQEKEWVFCPFCGHQTKFEDDYGSEVPSCPATSSVEDEPDMWTCTRCHQNYNAEEEHAVPEQCPRCGHPSRPSVKERS
jgi:hypothetical protein